MDATEIKNAGQELKPWDSLTLRGRPHEDWYLIDCPQRDLQIEKGLLLVGRFSPEPTFRKARDLDVARAAMKPALSHHRKRLLALKAAASRPEDIPLYEGSAAALDSPPSPAAGGEDAAMRSLAPAHQALLPALLLLGMHRMTLVGRSLLERQLRVAACLTKWSADADLVAAGLFHLCYPTAAVPEAPVPLSRRDEITKAIGSDAELLVFLSAVGDRAALLQALRQQAPDDGDGSDTVLRLLPPHGQITVTGIQFRRLTWLLCATFLDRAPDWSAKHMYGPADVAGNRAAIGLLRPFLPLRAHQDIQAVLDSLVASSPSLSTVLDLTDLSEFRRDFPTRFWHREGAAERLSFLPSTLQDLLDHPCQCITAVTGAAPGAPGLSSLSASDAVALYLNGATIYCHDVTLPEIDRLVKSVDQELGLASGLTRLSAFASRRGPGYPVHYDTNCNIVIQVRGVKRWRIGPNPHVRDPVVNHAARQPMLEADRRAAPQGIPSEPELPTCIDLKPGSVLFLPRGTWHTTETLSDESLHWNIQTGVVWWAILARYVLQECLGPQLLADDFRATVPLPVFGTDGRLRSEIASSLASRLQSLSFSDLVVRQPDLEDWLRRQRTSG